MRRLLLFLTTTLLLLSAMVALNWWVDPFGEFWKPAAVEEARASRPQCLVSHEVIGGRYLPFKLDVFRSRPTRTFVTGSSRVLKIRAHAGESTFSNLGMPVISPETVLREFEEIPGDAPPQTVYLGTEAFWFNPHFRGFDVDPSLETKARYVLSRSALDASLRIVRAAPYVLLHRWRRERLGRECIVGRSNPALAWNLDGSREWSFELQPGTYHPVAEPFTRDLSTLRAGNYADWTSFSAQRMRALSQALSLARSRGWRVVGFAPPDGKRYRRLFASDPVVGPRWREFARTMPRLFRRYGFTWLDLRDVRAIPCSEDDFVDGGYHTDAACSDAMRERLDRAAGELVGGDRAGPNRDLTLVALGDSIPAAQPRECGGCTGFVTLYGRALAHATKRRVRIENLAVPGSTSGDLRALLASPEVREALSRADAVIVSTGRNDTPWARTGDRCGSSCVRRRARVVGRNVGAALSAIRALRGHRPTLVRVTNVYNERLGDPSLAAGARAASKGVLDLYASAICGAAERHDVPCVDVYRAFNGATRTRPAGALLARDRIHPSQRGHDAIADALARAGFAPLAPGARTR